MTHFDSLPEEHAAPTSGRVVARLVAGLGFRFQWATEGLKAEDYAFRLRDDVMSIGELVEHLWGLTEWITRSVWTDRAHERPTRKPDRRLEVIERLAELRDAFADMADDDLAGLRIGSDHPFWNMLNGPIADALTHVGQINVLRRMAGNPTPKANVFLGRAPAADGT